MHLWTEYEGNTLAGYPIGRMQRSEGRSAFFLTTTPEGQPALLRLTESHFDEGELVGRWRKVSGVAHPNLQAIKHSGQITFDEVPLACCLLEPIDSSLADVLRERALTVEETKEVAETVAGALAALHATDLIHEHIDASNVFASGECVKLRSDCVRECTGDFEADTPEAREALRKRDVHDLGLLLLRCLGLKWQGPFATKIPVPFSNIIPRAMDGSLTAEGIATALKPVTVNRTTQAVPAVSGEQVASVKAADAGANPRVDTVAQKSDAASVSSKSAQRSSVKALRSGDPFDTGLGSLRNEPLYQNSSSSSIADKVRHLRPMTAQPISRKTYIISGTLAAMLALVLWVTLHGNEPAAAAPITSQTTTAEQAPAKSQVTATQTAHAPAVTHEAQSAEASLLTSTARAGWRVIAYTYNHEQQAQAKAIQLQKKYFDLQPQVFSPTGRAPYFVALGGPLNSTSAYALRNRARQAGLPRDTYARNF